MIAIMHARLIHADGSVMEDADVVIDGGVFCAVGPRCDIPADAQRVDGRGLTITPGLIDVHTHLGLHELAVGRPGIDVNETSAAATPHVRALDAINPFDRGFADAVRAGVTTVQVMPGSANVIGGEMVALKTAGRIVDQMVIKSPSAIKAAFGENPKNTHAGKERVVTRMGVAAVFRQQFLRAQDYQRALERSDNTPRDLGMENLCRVLRGEIPVRAHAHRADDICTALRLAEEFHIPLTIEHCTEGHLIADYIAHSGVRVSVGPTMSTKSKVELAEKGWHTLCALVDAGVQISITTDHPVVGIEYLVTAAATAVRHGLPEAAAWRAITIAAAEHIGVADRVGSLEVGKDADLVMWSGHPFDFRSFVRATWIGGQVVYDKHA
ncbi:MAG: amidohydrolase family protein [Firmicutes bacterium]|nr:amidohydrolase family protein [Bacillota bacterium]